MKNITTLLLLMLTFGYSQAQTPCQSYFPLDEGEEIVMISYDKKEKLDGYSVMELSEKSDDAASFSIDIYDKKGKESISFDYNITCDGDAMYINMESLMPQTQMKGMEDMEMTMEGDQLEMPANLSVGQDLKSATYNIKSEINGIPVSNMTIEVFDRKVESKETISTSVGDFECFKIVQTTKMKNNLFKMETKSEEYWCPGVGMIKSVSYDKKGSKTGHQIRGSRSDIK